MSSRPAWATEQGSVSLHEKRKEKRMRGDRRMEGSSHLFLRTSALHLIHSPQKEVIAWICIPLSGVTDFNGNGYLARKGLCHVSTRNSPVSLSMQKEGHRADTVRVREALAVTGCWALCWMQNPLKQTEVQIPLTLGRTLPPNSENKGLLKPIKKDLSNFK